MASIKFKFLKSTDYLIVLLISILGFSSACKKVAAEYGTPHADYIVIGKIESVVSNDPIPDIIVEMRNVIITEGGQSFNSLTGTGFSNSIGNYFVNDMGLGVIPKDRTYQIKFIDTDGALNGEYETLDTTVVFKDPVFTNGDGHWYKGIAEKELNIKLKPKK